MRSIRIHGSGLDKYDNVRIGINGRLDTFQAAILLEKLAIFNKELELRNQVAQYYNNSVSDNFQKPILPDQYVSSWAQYSLLSKSTRHREGIVSSLKKEKIPSMIYYRIPLHLQAVFKKLNYRKGDFPVAESIADRIFSLPMHPYLENHNQDKIVEILNS